MKFTHPSAKALHDRVKAAAAFCPSKPHLPVLGAVRLIAGKRVRVQATDLDNSCELLLPDATTSSPGEVVVASKALLAALKAAGRGAVTVFTTDGGGLVVRSEALGESWSPTINPAEYPLIGAEDSNDEFEVVDAVELREMLAGTVPFAYRQPDRPNLAGVYFDEHGAVGCDEHRLGMNGWKGDPFKTLLDTTINGNGCALLAKTLVGARQAMIRVEGSAVCVWTSAGKVWTRKVDAEYPEYQKVLQRDAPPHLRVNAAALRQALDGALKASAGRFRHNLYVYFAATASGPIDLLAGHTGKPAFAISRVHVELLGEPGSFWLDARYAFEALTSFGDRDVVVKWRRGLNPLAMECDDLPHVYRVIFPANFKKDDTNRWTDEVQDPPLRPGEVRSEPVVAAEE